MTGSSDTDSRSDEETSEDVALRQRELDAILAGKLSWTTTSGDAATLNDTLSTPQALNDEEEEKLATTAFPLFQSNNHVRLLSPSLTYTGPGKGRILEEAEEPKSVRKERKKRILDCAVDANWLHERSSAGYWTAHPHDARKLETRTLVPRRPLPNTALGLLKPSSLPKTAASSANAMSKPTLPTRTPKEVQRVKITPYPDAQKVRLAKKVTKRRFAITRKSKRKSKKRRDFEKAGKGKTLPGMSEKAQV